MELGGPVTAQLTFWSPSGSQRFFWLLPRILGSVLILVGIHLVRRMIRSARSGDPFTAANEQRLWALAGLTAIGGTAYSLIDGFTEMLLIQRSAAADLFVPTATLSFLPLIMGATLAMLAMVWRMGVQLRDDVEGTI